MNLNECVKQQLSAKRYQHSVRVAKTAVALAKLHGCDEKKAEVAGLLHDYCKEYSKEEQVRICVEQKLLASRDDLLMPQILHGPVASFILKQEEIVHDEAILQAIRYHTIGHPDMDVLAKIIFIADYIEPGRTTPDIKSLYDIAARDLDECIVEIVNRTTVYLINERAVIHENMIKLRNRILSKE